MSSSMFEGYSHNRRDETATPLCGTHRVGTKNALLQKPQLGCVRGSSYELPEDFQYTYGMAMKRDGMTAGKVIDNWVEHQGTKDQLPPKDFRALNKSALKAGKTSAKDVREHMTKTDIRIKLGRQTQPPPTPVDTNTTFGIPPRPNTPVNNLISHGFRYDWVMQSELAEDLGGGKKSIKPSPTRSSQFLKTANTERRAKVNEYPPPLPPTSDWKMSKFKNVKSKVWAS